MTIHIRFRRPGPVARKVCKHCENRRSLFRQEGILKWDPYYALCYKCHDRDVLLSDGSLFKPHRKHVVDALTPCSACHDAHGVSALQGNPVNNAHLIDFDVSVVQPNAQGLRIYESAGPGAGSCSLSCHGREHERTGY